MATSLDDADRGQRVGAILLAAGHGERMGTPKALLVLDGKTLVERHIERLVHLGCSTVVVVLRPEVAAKLDVALGRWKPQVHVVVARTRSPSESLLAGARALPASFLEAGDESAPTSNVHADAPRCADRVLVVPVDMMPPAPTLVRALHAALVPPLLAVTPSYQGRGGHPVLCRREVLVALARAAREGTDGASDVPSLRDVLRELGPRRARLELDDRSVLDDFDRPSDLPGSVEVIERVTVLPSRRRTLSRIAGRRPCRS